MPIQLSLQNPMYLSRNNLFRFPQDAGQFDITVVGDVTDELVGGILEDDMPAVDVLGWAPVVTTDNLIWQDADGDEQADVDGILNITVTEIIVELNHALEPDEMEDVPEPEEGRVALDPDEAEIDFDFDEDDEQLAGQLAKERDDAIAAADARRRDVEVQLSQQLVGQSLALEFTAGVLVQWSIK